jgi:hypothetical protein
MDAHAESLEDPVAQFLQRDALVLHELALSGEVKPETVSEAISRYGIDPDVFFPPSEEDAALALGFCAGCDIREMCLAWALKNRERYGVWGGTTEQQRRRLQRYVA